MKILILEPNPCFGGGSEGISLSLSQELAKRGHQIVLLHETEGSMLRAYRSFACDIVRMPLPAVSFRNPLRALTTSIRVSGVVREHNVDALFSSHLGFLVLGHLLRRFARIPACYHLGLSRETGSAVDRWAFRGASAGIAPSVHTMETWRRSGWPRQTLFVVPNWVDSERFAPSADKVRIRSELGLPQESPCICFVGRMCEEKGVDDLVAAFSLLRSDHSQATLILVGPTAPDYEPRLRAALDAMAPSLRGSVFRIGATPAPEKYLAAADLACVPSRWEEPFGLTVLEGMASGVPVVVTDVGVLAELVGGASSGLVVPSQSPRLLASCLSWWIANRELACERGAALRERAKAVFGSDGSVEKYEAIISAAVGRMEGR